MIYRERLNGAIVEYEGSPEEIDLFMHKVAERTAKAIGDAMSAAIKQYEEDAPLPGEIPSGKGTVH